MHVSKAFTNDLLFITKVLFFAEIIQTLPDLPSVQGNIATSTRHDVAKENVPQCKEVQIQDSDGGS